MNRQRTIRYLATSAILAAVGIPLVRQVRSAQTRQVALSAAPAQSPLSAPAASEEAAPTTMPAVDPNKVIATAGDVTVTAGEFEAVAAGVPPQYAAQLRTQTVRKRMVDQIIRVKLLAREAERRGIQNKPDVKRQLEMQRDEILTNALAQEMQGDTNEQADRAWFDANKSIFDDVKARHILIRTPDSPVPPDAGKPELTEEQARQKAQDIQNRLAKGGNFAEIARLESDDKSSGVRGGDLGTFAPWKMDPVFAKATLELKKNQVSGPVRTQFGYHIIQLLDDTPRTFDQAKGEVGQARWSSLLGKLNDENKTVYDQSFFDLKPTTRPAGANAKAPEKKNKA